MKSGPHPNLPPVGEGTANTQPSLSEKTDNNNDTSKSGALSAGKVSPTGGDLEGA
jgi:hypothetical protein